MKLLFILLTVLHLGLFAAEKSKSDDIDYVALAALLMKDGHYSRALESLQNADTSKKAFDFARYYTLKGMIFSKQLLYSASNEQFRLAIENGQSDKSVYLYIAQNSFKLGDYEAVLTALGKADELVRSKAKFMALKAESLWRLQRREEALAILAETMQRFPEYLDAYKQRFHYFVSLELYQSALEDARVYLNGADVDAKTTLSFISALRKSGATDKAIALAEQGNLRFSGDARLTVMLAHLYLDKEMVQAAADLFDEASIKDSAYTKEAAEMLRRAKEYTLSLYKNAQILEMKEKFKQRIAIYLEFADYERIVAMHEGIVRSELIENEDIRYALAYAYYMVGDFQRCEEQLSALSRPDLFEKATELRNSMEKCENNQWECQL